jgi:hypothetical protein
MLPFYVKDASYKEDPAASHYYLLAREGLYLVRRSPFFSTELVVQGLPWLQPHQERVQLNLPAKVPVALLDQATAFFAAVFERHQSEAILLLYYRPATEQYEMVAPHQYVTPLTCDYDLAPTPDGLVRVGTLHSHGALEAGHSDVDERDERYDDGLHFTVGSLDALPQVSCELVAGGRRFPVPLEQVLDRRRAEPVPAEWLAAVEGGLERA